MISPVRFLRLLNLRACFALGACTLIWLGLSGCGHNVEGIQVTAQPTVLREGESSSILAVLTAPSGGPPANGTVVDFSFTPDAATLSSAREKTAANPPTAGWTALEDQVRVNLTAKAVAVDTVVTVTAAVKSDDVSNTATVKILPPLVTAIVSGTSLPCPGVLIAPTASGDKYVYQLTSVAGGGTAPTITHLTMTFARAVKVTSTSSGVASGTVGGTVWDIKLGGGVTSLKIEVKVDGTPGGVAKFDVTDDTSGAEVHYLGATIGPKP